MKILIAEDDFVSRKVLHKMLSSYGKCDFAVDGEEAITAFEFGLAKKSLYNLICLDINMPKLSGFETLQQIRSIEERNNITGLSGVKVIMTTGDCETQTILKAFKTGCEAYLIKPINPEKLKKELYSLGLIKE